MNFNSRKDERAGLTRAIGNLSSKPQFGALSLVGFEPITDARFGFDQARFGGVGFDFLTEMGNVNAKVLPVLLGLRSPDFAEDVAMSEDPAGMADEQAQERVLRG